MLREVRVENGLVRGLPAADPRITAYKGIPYAAPPVGDLRWKAPQPAKDWEGVLEAYHFGPLAMQETPGEGPNPLYTKEWHVDPTLPMSEDCLHLNVWTPAKSADEKLPVMVWIFGGGLRCGYPSEMEFDGERIARRGVILVSINYRLNAFGFLAHSELTNEDPEFPTNFGHLDQRFAIQWVKRNIAAFGGDPDNITVFGQSAGGGSTLAQVVSPLNKGLFQKAICQSSGGVLPPSLMGNRLETAEKLGEEFLADLGVRTIEEARALDARVILKQALSTRKYGFGTVVDDKFMPDFPSNLLMSNRRNDMLLMIGHTVDEFPVESFASTYEEFEAYAREYFGDRADEYIEISRRGAEDLEHIKMNGKYSRFKIGNLIWADINNKFNAPKMYLYEFNPEIPGDDSGSFHSSELWFVFETLAKCWRPFTGKHYDLARHICNYWTNFAKNGDPNGPDADGTPMPEWRPVQEGDCKAMYFGDVAAMDEKPRTELENFLVDFFTKRFDSGEDIKYAPYVRQDGTRVE
ncbi:MAG: carboxylesterase family protein [Clostridiales bacterium]|jgi:para-nitrobenzyl esterase|nr:carboxylesterase family protein [Clostridiales bacterium]